MKSSENEPDPASIREEVRAVEGPLSPDELEETVSRALDSFGGSTPATEPTPLQRAYGGKVRTVDTDPAKRPNDG